MKLHTTLLTGTAGLIAVLASACGGDSTPGTCSLNFASEVNATFDNGPLDALIEAAAKFSLTATEMDEDLNTACNAINTDLGATTAEDTETACNNAAAAIEAALTQNATATLTVEYVPGVCSVAAQAIIDCTAECDASFDATATPPTCEGGELSGGCSGSCSGECTIEASASCEGTCSAMCTGECNATVTATCTGTCNGQCDGTCSAMDGDGNCAGECTGTCRGECDGTIEGTCSGTCNGSCSGSCRAEVTGSCEGSCSGSCDVMFEAPRCEGGELNVEASADCEAACESDASFEVECTPAEVVVSFTGAVDDAAQIAALVATLEANFPAILAVAEKAPIVVGAAADFAGQLEGAVSSAANIGLEASDCLARAIEAQVAAAASVSVSVEASVSVSGSVSAN